MTVAHKDLTGTDLHEVKGASTATVGQVPVANGSGGAPFALLTHTSLTTTGNPFGAQLLHVRNEQASGTGDSSTFGSNTTMQLNTVKTNEITGASLASHQITLPAGTYFIYAIARGVFAVNSGNTYKLKGRLRNITAGTTILLGSTVATTLGGAGFGAVGPAESVVAGRFTLGGAAVLELQAYASFVAASQGTGSGETEVYSEVLIWKVA